MIHTDIPSSLETDRIITVSLRPAWATEGDLASKPFFFFKKKNYLKNPVWQNYVLRNPSLQRKGKV